MTYCHEQTIAPTAVGPAMVALLEYLGHRQQPINVENIVDIEDLIDERLLEACGARRYFRQIATPALRMVRSRAASGELALDYDRLVGRYAQRKETPIFEIVDEMLRESAVQRIIERFGLRPSLIDTLRTQVEESGIALRVDGDMLVVRRPRSESRIINDAGAPLGPDSLLRQIGRTWATKGRGLATIIVGPDGNSVAPEEISWANGFAHALVQAAWLFDRDVRNLEDCRSLPSVEGNDGGATVSIVGGVLVAVGIALILFAQCVDDPDTAMVLTIIGLALTIAGIAVLAAEGVPIEVCRTDRVTGRRVCARI